MSDELLVAYDEARPRYVRYVDVLQALLTEILATTTVRVHSVVGRVKERASFRAKILAAPERYQTLNDVTDVAGLRVITYFSDDVETAGSTISHEFDVLETHSSDKRDLLSDGEFGYLSLHYVVRLHDKRARLLEQSHVAGLLAEIQVRSILQHAWAEIEHDLGYKTPIAIPRHVRREFARLAALLEGADNTFVALRNLLRTYDDDLRSELANESGAIRLDVASLRTYLRVSGIAAEINRAIQSSRPFSASNNVIARHVRQLSMFGIDTVGELDKQMRREAAAIAALGQTLREGSDAAGSEVLPVVYLEYLLLARSRDEALIGAILTHMPLNFMDHLRAVVMSLDEPS